MTKTNFILMMIITVCAFTITYAEPRVSYDTGPIHIYSNLNNNWWKETPASTYRQNITPDGHTSYEKKLDEGPIVNSYLSSNINNLNLSQGRYARTDNSWKFASARTSAPTSNGFAATNMSSNNSNSDNRKYRALNSDTDTGGALAGLWFFEDDDDGNRRSSFSTINYIYITDPSVDPEIPVAPAPASILLGTIGVAIVGFLRNRKIKTLS